VTRVLLCTLALSLSGCLSISATARFGPWFPDETLARIVPGETTRAMVLAELGPPDEFLRTEVVDALNDDEARISRSIQIGNRALDVLTWQHDRLRARGRFWLLYLWLENEVESRILMISFDAQDRVRDLSLRELDDG